jgi:amino acid transporter
MPAQRLSRRIHPAVQRAASLPAGGQRFLGPGGIALITVAAILTLRSLPSLAEYGWSSIAFYLMGALFFFIPLAFVSAELATGWPRAGGVYAWVKQGFGPQLGFLSVWFDWIENVVWFPTVLSFISATIAYMFDPALADNKVYLVVVMLAVFWALTLANFFGLKRIVRFNNVAVIAGTLFPVVVLIALGAYWLIDGRTSAIPFHAAKLIPNFGNINDVVFFAGVLLGFAGIEMAGFHAKEIRNVRRDYPRAVFMSTAMIVGVSILATLSIAVVVPKAKLSLVAGLMQAFQDFFNPLGVGSWATKIMAGLVGIGTLALISTWLLGPATGVYAAEESGDLPPEVHYVNKRHVPVALLLFQGALGTLFSLLFLFGPGISTSYWMLTALTTQLTVCMYLLLLVAAIRLRYTEPDTERPYRVPGGRFWGMWIVAGMGILGSAFGLVIGFFPPSGISHWPTPIYIGAMLVALVLCSLPPFLADIFKKPSWRIQHPDPVLLDLPASPVSEPEPEPERQREPATASPVA